MSLRTTRRLSQESELEQGTVDEVAAKQRREREELRKRQRLHLAESTSRPRLDLADLRFNRYYVEYVPSGERYRVCRGDLSWPG